MKRYKWLKMIFRFNFGFGIALMILSVLIKIPFDWLGIITRIVIIFVYIIIYNLFWKIRDKYNKPFCHECDLGRYPFCKHNYDSILEAIKEMEEKEMTHLVFYDVLVKLEIQIRENRGEEFVEILKF